MNIIHDSWIPVIRRNGDTDFVSPCEITTKPRNPIIYLNFNRADFNATGYRLLISIYNTFFSPNTKKEWKELYHNPPNKKKILPNLKSQFFELNGTGPRFLQDKRPNELQKIVNVNKLLFETPGAKTIKEGKDFFQKVNTHILCPSCATVALYLAQFSAIMAGMGYRTGITSGANGSLTTIITGNTLWQTIWSNVIVRRKMYELGGNCKETIFPWLNDTIDSNSGATISLNNQHPYYPLWEMPLRYYFIFEKFNTPCTICGLKKNLMVKNIKTKNYGNCYVDPRHITSPYQYITDKEISFLKPIDHPNYSDLVKYLFKSEKISPAEVVNNFMNNINDLNPGPFGLWTFGYHMDKAKLFCWEENRYSISELLYKDKDFTSKIAQYSYLIGWYINNYVRKTWGIDKSDPLILRDFMKKTEDDFYKVLKTKNLKVWIESMVIQAFIIYEKYVGKQKFGLQKYYKEEFIDTLNKKIVNPLGLENLEFQDFTHIEYRKLNLPHFPRSFVDEFLSWYGKIKITDRYKIFSQEENLETILNHPLFLTTISRLSEFLPALEKEEIQEKFAAALIIGFSAKKLDFRDTFPAQIALQGILQIHLNEMISIKDVVENRNVFKDIVKQLEGLNVVSFMEGFIYWNKDVKSYWEKEYIKNI